MPLEPDDQRHLTTAEGYLELGMYLDANQELERIEPDLRHLPEVLAVRLEIYSALKKWELMQIVAAKLAKEDPDEVHWIVSLAYATRRAESIEAAREVLLQALDHHPQAAILHYNLACYECQLGDMEGAKMQLQAAFNFDKRFRQIALEDEDLEPLWLYDAQGPKKFR